MNSTRKSKLNRGAHASRVRFSASRRKLSFPRSILCDRRIRTHRKKTINGVLNLSGATPDSARQRRALPELGIADVLATLEKGELKGKKIGSTWRVTKTALDEFLKT
jgi:hypothetical protein